MLAQCIEGLGVGRLGAGTEDDRHAIGTALRDRLIAGQQHDDPVDGQMLDRDAGKAAAELTGNGVGGGNTRPLSLEPAHRFVGCHAERSGILDRILR